MFSKRLLMSNIPANSSGYISDVSTPNITYGEIEYVDVSADVPNNYYVIITINDAFTSNALNFNDGLILGYPIPTEYVVI